VFLGDFRGLTGESLDYVGLRSVANGAE